MTPKIDRIDGASRMAGFWRGNEPDDPESRKTWRLDYLIRNPRPSAAFLTSGPCRVREIMALAARLCDTDLSCP